MSRPKLIGRRYPALRLARLIETRVKRGDLVRARNLIAWRTWVVVLIREEQDVDRKERTA